MTVAELIALLSTMPQELPVTDAGSNGHMEDETEIRAMRVEVVDGAYIPADCVGEGYRRGPHVRIG